LTNSKPAGEDVGGRLKAELGIDASNEALLYVEDGDGISTSGAGGFFFREPAAHDSIIEVSIDVMLSLRCRNPNALKLGDVDVKVSKISSTSCCPPASPHFCSPAAAPSCFSTRTDKFVSASGRISDNTVPLFATPP
jgi:hypothetical protein